MPDDLLTQGIAAVKAGNKQEARRLLDAAIRAAPNDERTWGWFYNVCENDEERIRCLREVLRINPNRETVKKKLDELTGLEPPLLSPKPQPVTPTRLSQPIQKVEKKGNHTWIWIVVLAILVIILCVGGVIVFGKSLISNPANLQPTETNVPAVIDVPSLLGKSVDDIRALYQIDQSLPLQELGDNLFGLPNNFMWEAYNYGKYNFDFIYNPSKKVVGFGVDKGLIDDHYYITDWRIITQMFGIKITSLPDHCFILHEFSCSNIDVSFNFIRWDNYNGLRIWMVTDTKNNFVDTISILPPVAAVAEPVIGIGVTKVAIQSVFENLYGFKFTKNEQSGNQPCILETSLDTLSYFDLCGPPENLMSAGIVVFTKNNATEESRTTSNKYLSKFLELAVPGWNDGNNWLNSISTQGIVETSYGNSKISMTTTDLSDGKMQVLSIEAMK